VTSCFDNYALGGVSKIAEGFFVVLIDRRDPQKRVVIRPGETSEFRVISVNWSNQDWKQTSVVLTDGRSTSPVGFDETLLISTQKNNSLEATKPRLPRQAQ
jgi:hypothetical protein